MSTNPPYVRMPGLDGVGTLRLLRQSGCVVPVVMFSTAMMDEEVAACQELKVQAFVQKPADYAGFHAAVTGILQGKGSGVQPAHMARPTLPVERPLPYRPR